MTDELRGRETLVTGGAGFIGSHLVRTLTDANGVTVVDNFSNGERSRVPDDVTVIEGDVEDDGTLQRVPDSVDTIFHLAALVSVDESVNDPRSAHEANADATVAVLERAREIGARVVFASSCAVYGEPQGVPISESAPTAPRSPYGAQKLYADHLVRQYDDLYDIDTVVLRYFNVYGPGQRGGPYSGVIGVFVEQAEAGEPLTVHGDGRQTRDFVHVSDVVRANLYAARTDETGVAFNVGTGESTSIRELAETVVRTSDSDSDIVYDDPRPGDIERSRADTTRARARLGFESQVSLDRGVETVLDR